jgi:hypothetical protein
LPILCPNQQVHEFIPKFIQIFVNFWIIVIPPPQNEESKYSIERLSEDAEYNKLLMRELKI